MLVFFSLDLASGRIFLAFCGGLKGSPGKRMSTVCPPALKAVAWFGTRIMTRGRRGGLRGALNPEPCVLRTTSPDTDLSGEAARGDEAGVAGTQLLGAGCRGRSGPPGAGRCQGAFSRGAPRRVPRGNLGFRLPASRAVRTRFWGFQPSGLVPVAAAAGNSPRLPPLLCCSPGQHLAPEGVSEVRESPKANGPGWGHKPKRKDGSLWRREADCPVGERGAPQPCVSVGSAPRPGRRLRAIPGSSRLLIEAVRGYLGDQGTRAVAPSGALRPRGPTCPGGGERARGPAKRPGRISLCRVRVLLRVTVHG